MTELKIILRHVHVSCVCTFISYAFMPTCLFIQCKQTGHVPRKDVIGDLAKPARVLVRSDDVEDFCADLCVAADAHGVLVRVKHWSVVI